MFTKVQCIAEKYDGAFDRWYLADPGSSQVLAEPQELFLFHSNPDDFHEGMAISNATHWAGNGMHHMTISIFSLDDYFCIAENIFEFRAPMDWEVSGFFGYVDAQLSSTSKFQLSSWSNAHQTHLPLQPLFFPLKVSAFNLAGLLYTGWEIAMGQFANVS